MESFHKKHGMGKMRVRGTDVYRAGKRIEFFLFIRLTSEGRKEKGERSSKVAFLFYRPRFAFRSRKREKSAVDFKREGDEKQLGGKNEARLRFLWSEGNTHACENVDKGGIFFSFFFFLSSRERARFSLRKERGFGIERYPTRARRKEWTRQRSSAIRDKREEERERERERREKIRASRVLPN